VSEAEATITDEQLINGQAPEADAQETALARAATAAAGLADFTLPVRHKYDQAQVEVIRKTVAKDCNPAELAMFLEVAARYGLDPFAREIFAAKFDGQNGAVTIYVGRDGMLKVAKKSGKFVRMESAVVCEKDVYSVVMDMDGDEYEAGHRVRKIHHERKGMGRAARGKIVGAYALVWREGDPQPWFAEASWDDYGEKRQATRNGNKTNWTIGHGHPEAMMIKVPEAIALRKAFGLSGLYGAEEVGADAQELPAVSGDGNAPTVQWGDDELGAELRVLVERANDLVPAAWRPTKVAMKINGKSDEERAALRDQLLRFIEPRDPEFVRAMVESRQAAESITDAEVVEEPGEDSPETGQAASDEPPAAYDGEAHATLASNIADMRSAMDEVDDADAKAELEAQLEAALSELAVMNDAAEAAGATRIEL
jgi:phage recombination protein Bet